MNVLILGSGGRECAFAWKISQSTLLTKLYIAPGNAGTIAYGENIALEINDFEAIAEVCLQKQILLILVGPEEPLVKGITDYFASIPRLSDIKVFGPGKAGARLEGSKEYAKIFMTANQIPTAAFASFTDEQAEYAHSFIDQLPHRFVIKADGLAAGKGVILPRDKKEAHSAIDDILIHKKFGKAGNILVIEEFLEGIELSVFVVTDGVNYKLLPAAKDYKRIGEQDTGLNTGGMGAVSPVPYATDAFMQKVEEKIVKPTLQGLQEAGIHYKGFIFIGLMSVNSEPFVVEYNVRMGDPETEVVLPRIESDFLALILDTMNGQLSRHDLRVSRYIAATVMIVSGGYPENYEKGLEIAALTQPVDGIYLHAGTKISDDKVLTSGGRVIACTGWGETLGTALQKAYDMAADVEFKNLYYRRDIGVDLL